MTLFTHDAFMKAYPFDIAGGLIVGGTITMLISVYNYSAPMVLIGELCVIIGIFMAASIAIYFDGGMHFRRV